LLTAPVPETRDDGSIIQEHFDENALGATTCYACHRADGAQPKYAGDRPFGLLLSPDGTSLYVTHLRESRLTVLDLTQGEIESTTSLAPAGTASEVVAIARLEDEIWVALRPPQPSTDSGALRRLHAETLEPIADLEIGSDPDAYAPLYEAVISGDTDAAIYLGTDRQFLVKSELSMDMDLAPGSYTASVTGFSGAFSATGSVSNNIVGQGVTGIFYSVSNSSSSITFTVK